MTAGVRPVVGRPGIRAAPARGGQRWELGSRVRCVCVGHGRDLPGRGVRVCVCAEQERDLGMCVGRGVRRITRMYVYICVYIYIYIHIHLSLPAHGQVCCSPPATCPISSPVLLSSDEYVFSSPTAATTGAGSGAAGRVLAREHEESMRPEAAMFVGAGRGFGGATDRPTEHGPVPAPRTTAERDHPPKFATPRNRGGSPHGLAPTSAGEYM